MTNIKLEPWYISGIHTGWRVVEYYSGASSDYRVVKGFPFDMYDRESYDAAKYDALAFYDKVCHETGDI